MKDTIVEEVRRARENIARKCGYSIPRMAARQRARTAFQQWPTWGRPFRRNRRNG